MSDKRVFDNGDKAAGNKIEVHVIERMDKVDFSDGIPKDVVSKLPEAAFLENLDFVVGVAKNKVVNGICFTPFNKYASH